MKGKIFTELQFGLITAGKKTSFWEVVSSNSSVATPKYKVGEVLYLKEPYKKEIYNLAGVVKTNFLYRYGISESCDKVGNHGDYFYSEWKNKLFMPAVVARYFIEITSVEKENLNNVFCRDCLDEGMSPVECHKNKVKGKDVFVWGYSFRLVEKASISR